MKFKERKPQTKISDLKKGDTFYYDYNENYYMVTDQYDSSHEFKLCLNLNEGILCLFDPGEFIEKVQLEAAVIE